MKPEGYNSMRCQILHRLGMGMPCCDINIQITQSSRTRTMHYVSLLGNQRIHTRSRNQLYMSSRSGTGSVSIVCTGLTPLLTQVARTCSKRGSNRQRSTATCAHEAAFTVYTSPEVCVCFPSSGLIARL